MKGDNLFIGIDSGTQGTKGVVVSENTAKVIAESYVSYDLVENNRGGREQDPALWLDAVRKVILDLCNNTAVDPGYIRGIGISGQQHGMVVLDQYGEVIRPAKLWCDTETEKECDEIIGRLGGVSEMVKLTGNNLAVGFTASKLLWLKNNEPEAFARIDSVLLPHDYINFWLTGEKSAEFGDASGTGYFDVVQRCWAQPVIDAIDPSGQLNHALPRLIDSDAISGVVRDDRSIELGLPKGVVVASGGGDNMMAAIGTGNVKAGVVTASLGTSGTIYAHSEIPVVDSGGELAAFCSSTGGWLPLVCTMNVTVPTELTRGLLGIDLKAMNELIAEAPAGAEGILLHPYFQGERTPALPSASANLSGLTSNNFSAANLARSAMEGATFGLRYGLDVMIRNGLEPKEIRLTGGGAKSAIWRQIVADIFGCPVVPLESDEAGALGAAIQAIWASKKEQGERTDLVDLVDRFVVLQAEGGSTPVAENVSIYREVYSRYLELGSRIYG